MIDMIFNWCVDLLIKYAELLGLTYNEINVWIFIIIMPLFFTIMLFTIIKQTISIKRLNNKIKFFKQNRVSGSPNRTSNQKMYLD